MRLSETVLIRVQSCVTKDISVSGGLHSVPCLDQEESPDSSEQKNCRRYHQSADSSTCLRVSIKVRAKVYVWWLTCQISLSLPTSPVER